MSSGSSSTSASNAVIESRAYIHYYVRCGYSRTLINYTADQLKRRGGESWIVFWRAFGLAREGNIVAALRDCDTLKNKRDAEYAALLAMVHYHQRAKLIDHDALSIAEASLKSKSFVVCSFIITNDYNVSYLPPFLLGLVIYRSGV